MPSAVRVVNRIQDQADFDGSVADGQFLVFDNATGKFVHSDLVIDGGEIRGENGTTGQPGGDIVIRGGSGADGFTPGDGGNVVLRMGSAGFGLNPATSGEVVIADENGTTVCRVTKDGVVYASEVNLANGIFVLSQDSINPTITTSTDNFRLDSGGTLYGRVVTGFIRPIQTAEELVDSNSMYAHETTGRLWFKDNDTNNFEFCYLNDTNVFTQAQTMPTVQSQSGGTGQAGEDLTIRAGSGGGSGFGGGNGGNLIFRFGLGAGFGSAGNAFFYTGPTPVITLQNSGEMNLNGRLTTTSVVATAGSTSTVPITAKGSGSSTNPLVDCQDGEGQSLVILKKNSAGGGTITLTTTAGASWLEFGSNIAIGYATTNGNFFSDSTTGDVCYRAASGSTLKLGVDNGGGSAASMLTVSSSGITANGGITPASMADSAAANGTMYYSTDAGKLVFKDSGGVVNNLY